MQAGEQWPGDRAAVSGDEPERDVRIGEIRALGDEDDVGERDEAASQSDRGSVHRGDDRDAARGHPGNNVFSVRECLLAERRVSRQLVEVVEVAARGERAAVAGEYDGACVGVGVDLREQARERVVQFVVRRVQLVRSVEPHDADRSVLFDLDHGGNVVAAHDAGSPRMRRATRFFWICVVPPMTLWARL